MGWMKNKRRRLRNRYERKSIRKTLWEQNDDLSYWTLDSGIWSFNGMTYRDRDCPEGEIELWGECYDIETTTSLSLADSGLTGEIPPEIGNLINLEYLNLTSNQLTGEIPPEIGNLANLLFLYLHTNQLTGEIPPEIANLSHLWYFKIHDNQLSGEWIENLCPVLGWQWSTLYNNKLCPACDTMTYPNCIEDENVEFYPQDTSDCSSKCFETDPIPPPGEFGGGYGGCTEPKALNYNALADHDNGSCEFFEIQIKVGIQWEDAHTTDLVLKFGFSPAMADVEDFPGPDEDHCYPFGSDCLSYMDEPEDTDEGHSYSSGNYYLEDYSVPPYAPPSGFHAAIGTEWSGPTWFWINWLNYSSADYGVDHIFRIHMDLPFSMYMMNNEIACDIKFDWIAQHWRQLSQLAGHMRLTDAFDGALGVDIDVEEIINSPGQAYRWFPELHGEIAHLHITPRP